MPLRCTIKRALLLALPALVFLALASTAHAQAASSGVLDNVVNQYQAATTAWSTKFLTYANTVFWILAGIEFSWVAILLGLRQADLQEWVSDLVRWILITGFFWALLQNGTTWVPAIINSFWQAGDGANQAFNASLPSGVSPSFLLDLCLKLAAQVCDSASAFNPASLVFVGLFGIAILVAGAIIAMTLVCAIVEMYIVTAASMLLLGFGGSRWTRDYATKILTYAVSIGVKIMILQLLIGLGQNFVSSFATAYASFSVENIAPLLVALIVLCGLVRSVPQIAQSMISGVHIHTGGGFGAAMGAAQMGMVAANAATAATMGGTGVLLAATQLAATQGRNAAAAAVAQGGSNLGLGNSVLKAVNFTGRMAGNVAKAAAQDITAGMKGDRYPYTNMAQRMTAKMIKKADISRSPRKSTNT